MYRKRSTLGRQALHGMTIAEPTIEGRRIQRVQSFHTPFRRHVADVARRASCFEDLADSFPGLLFALATGYGTVETRRAAAAHVVTGSPLREAADALGLPWWTRKLPPQAFTQRLAELPQDPSFATRIVNLLPDAPASAGKWLERVLHAYRTCHSDFALWVAKHDRLHNSMVADPALPYLAAWAWHAKHPETLGGRLLRRGWHPSMSPNRAFDELTIWRKRLRLALSLSSLEREPWLTGGTSQGYEFVELRTVDDFIAESTAMDNCLDAFSEKLEAGVCYVFSIREKGVPVADVEIGPHPQDAKMPTIVQLRAPRNRRSNPNIWRAAYDWLGSQPLRPAPPLLVDAPQRRRAWRELWKPYVSTLEPTDRAVFEQLAVGLDRLKPSRSPSRAASRTQRATEA